MLNKVQTLIALAAGLGMHGARSPIALGGRTVSPVQQRMHAAWEADAPRRNALALEIKEWNRKVKRRNQRHVQRNKARGRLG